MPLLEDATYTRTARGFSCYTSEYASSQSPQFIRHFYLHDFVIILYLKQLHSLYRLYL